MYRFLASAKTAEGTLAHNKMMILLTPHIGRGTKPPNDR
jgi:hypothetical protein